MKPSKNRVLPTDQEFWQVSTPRAARARIIEALRFGFLGPEAPDEVLSESPLTHYAAGMLAPFGTDIPEEEHDEHYTGDAEDEETGAVDLGPPVSQAITPSSIGISFIVPASTRKLVVRATWGDYRAEETHTENGRPEEREAAGRSTLQTETRAKERRPRMQWVRTPRVHSDCTILLAPDDELQSSEIVAGDRVAIEHRSRTLDERLAVSVFLVNRRPRDKKGRGAVDSWIFQPSLTVRPASSDQLFVPRELEPSVGRADRDLESNRLLFRGRREFATGHGCSADWTTAATGDRAVEVRTELLPQYELPSVGPPSVEGAGLDMEALADASSPEKLRSLLTPLVDQYERWVTAKHAEVPALAEDLQGVARAHLGECAMALERIRSGIELIERDAEVCRAFQFANRAMLLQRSHSVWARRRREKRDGAEPEVQLRGAWRPFQLGFFLLNLPGLADDTCDDRAIGDLLWFPTGGGKTEAYLGLAAFTMALRRRRTCPGMRTDAGLSVLMRYTLRLLTIQQFQRAATLVCAAESLRARDPETWGDYRFSIGLWLGSQGTPNRHDESRRALVRLQEDPSVDDVTACVLEYCPWCGEKLTPQDYWIDGEARKTRLSCSRSRCRFHRASEPAGLPVVVVDEEIYRECPSMIIATVDKFAQMPWNGNVQALFGIVDRECERCGFLTAATDHVRAHRTAVGEKRATAIWPTERLAPPELIIQDELHLISGPLGTLVGLYETAVDYLASYRVGRSTVRPKVIASTATVRRAVEQVRAVFERRLKVFPPAGLDPNESFFATEHDVSDDAPGRMYIGLYGPGKSMKTAYVRVSALLLAGAQGIGTNPALAEPYMTIISYFNSLRELGGAIRLMDDDVPTRLEQHRVSDLVVSCEYNNRITIGDLQVSLYQAGHILGASSVLIQDQSGRKVFFSGDFSSFPQFTVPAADWPNDLGEIDVLVLESTYGARNRPPLAESRDELISFVRSTLQNGGSTILASFGLGRAQELLWLIGSKIENGELPDDVPVYIDGMIRQINPIYSKFTAFRRLENFYDVSGQAERQEVARNAAQRPMIIVTTSGMLSGGPVVEYARKLLPDGRHRLVLTGYQDEGAPSRELLGMTRFEKDARTVRIPDERGKVVEFRAAMSAKEIKLSAHADQAGLIQYAARLQPRNVLLVHGEPRAQESLRRKLLDVHPDARIQCGPSQFQDP